MAVELEDVDEDLISCRICFLRFDEELHKPKYLDCHHSFCIMCIQVYSGLKKFHLRTDFFMLSVI